MGLLRRIVEGGSTAPRLDVDGVDLTDIDSLGGSWKAILSAVHETRAQAQAAEEFIESRKVPATAASGLPVAQHMREFAASLQRHVVTDNPRIFAALLLALPTDTHRSNALDLYQRGWFGSHGATGVPVYEVLRMGPARKPENRLAHGDFAVLGAAFGWPATALLDALLDDGWTMSYRDLTHIAGMDDFLRLNADAIQAALRPAAKDHTRIWARLGALATPETLPLFRAEICDAVTANAKALRKAVGSLYERLDVCDQVEGLRSTLVDAKPAQRGRVIEAAGQLSAGSEQDAFVAELREELAVDRSAAVKEALSSLDSAGVSEAPDLPTVTPAEIPLRSFPTSRGSSNSYARVNGAGVQSWGSPRALADLLRTDHRVLRVLTPHHVGRLLFERSPNRWAYSEVLPLLSESPLRPTPVEVSAVLTSDGVPERQIVELCGTIVGTQPSFWSVGEITDWARYHLQGLISVLDDKGTGRSDREGFFLLLDRVDPRPAVLQTAIIRAAISGYKTDRSATHSLLDESCVDEVLPFLGSRKRTERIGAAGLLKSLQASAAADVVRSAARKEKDDGVLTALLAALDSMGEPLDEFLSTEALAAQARTAMGKNGAVPKSVAWLNVGALPPVSWANGSGQVDPTIIHWFLVSAVRGKTSEPSPLMLRHFENFNRADLRSFGSALLDLWIWEDTRTMTEEEVQAEAVVSAQRSWSWMQNRPGNTTTLAQLTTEAADRLRGTPVGSATASKGLLAVVAGSAGPDVAERAGSYIRKHRGTRMSQAKSLLQMLAWIDEPATVQQVMAIGARFRPKGIQNAAIEQAELLAERRGWSLEDLADRSVPDAGFENTGRQVLDYGTRTFTAHLGDDLSISLVNDETAKTVRSLPKGRADEDADVIAELKKDFTAAKKELKSVAALQPVRLHQAMCTQRSWSPDDFQRYFVDHPVMARLASRLVWMATSDEQTPIGFRPLTDGTLLDVDDEELSLPAEARITLAHGHLLPEAEVGWIEHLRDYEVDPLFPQFDRPKVSPDAGTRTVGEFVGHLINDGTLRSQVNRHAWQMGSPMDAGIINEIVKDVPTADLRAVVSLHGGFDAGGYDVGSTIVALDKFFFVSMGAPSWNAEQSAVELVDVPPVALSEFYAEVQAIALAGDGFAPDFKEKVTFG